MSTPIRLAAVCALSVLWLAPRAAAQTERPRADKTLSPFFFVEGGDPAVDRLPLKDTRVDVAISGVIADVTVRQVYENHGNRPLHARYVFPASTRAAVYGMTMTTGNTRIVATIKDIRGHRIIVSMILLSGCASLIVSNAYQAQMPNFAQDLGHGSAGFFYGLLLAADAAGALAGGLVLWPRSFSRGFRKRIWPALPAWT